MARQFWHRSLGRLGRLARSATTMSVVAVTSYGSTTVGYNRLGASFFGQNSQYGGTYGNYGVGNIGLLVHDTCTGEPVLLLRYPFAIAVAAARGPIVVLRGPRQNYTAESAVASSPRRGRAWTRLRPEGPATAARAARRSRRGGCCARRVCRSRRPRRSFTADSDSFARRSRSARRGRSCQPAQQPRRARAAARRLGDEQTFQRRAAGRRRADRSRARSAAARNRWRTAGSARPCRGSKRRRRSGARW